MNTKQIEYVIKIAETKSILKASEELFITPSALDQQLLKIEKELNTKLFNRARQNMLMTQAGKVYVSYAKKILMLKREAYSKISEIAECLTGSLRIGLLPERGIEMFVNVYPQFYNLYRYVTIVPKELRSRLQISMLKENDLDLGFLAISEAKLTNYPIIFTCIYTEPFVLAIPATHKMTQECRNYTNAEFPLPIDLLKDSSFVLMYDEYTQRSVVNNFFNQIGVKPNVVLQTGNNYSLMKIVESGYCCSVFPEYYAYPSRGVKYFRLKDIKWSIYACYQRGYYINSAAKTFIDLCKSYWDKNHRICDEHELPTCYIG